MNDGGTVLAKKDRNFVCPDTSISPTPQVWRSVRLGTGISSGKDLFELLKEREIQLGPWIENMLESPIIPVNAEEREVSLITLSPLDLGFKRSVEYQRYCQRGLDLGFSLCSPEVGLYLILQNRELNISLSTLHVMAMEAILCSDNRERVFCLNHTSSNPGIFGGLSGDGRYLGHGSKLIFMVCDNS